MARANPGAMRRLAAAWSRQRAVLRTATGRWMAGVLALVGVATAIALIASWPHGNHRAPGQIVIASEPELTNRAGSGSRR